MGRYSSLGLCCFLILASGCKASGVSPGDGGPPMDAGADAGPKPQCTSNDQCGSGFVCAAVNGVPQCVQDPNPPPPGDGTTCGSCPAPGECRSGVCVQPSSTGALCEFDDDCTMKQLCIAGRCTPDPRTPTPCTMTSDCYAGLTCGSSGTCVCVHTTDCPIGLTCTSGACVTGGAACVADSDCMTGQVCTAGRCQDRTVCDITNPDLSSASGGDWNMVSVLDVRDALPTWLSDFLNAVAAPFSFLAGDASCIDFGLPTWVETQICNQVRPLIQEYVPSWTLPIFRAVSQLNTVLSTWQVQETMQLNAGSVPDSYRGTEQWNSITFQYRSMPVTGTPATIPNWHFSPSPFNATAVCGVFQIERHAVNVSISAIVAWLVDALVDLLSNGAYQTLADAVGAVTEGFCMALAQYAQDNVNYDVQSTVQSVCTTQIENLTNAALQRLAMAAVGASPITLQGDSPIAGPNSLRPGVWYGTLVGSDFPGTFSADR